MSETFTLAEVMEGSDTGQDVFTYDDVYGINTDLTERKTLGFGSSIVQSFMRGDRSSKIDTMGWDALTGGDSNAYLQNVKPEKDRFYEDISNIELDDSTWYKKLGLSLAEMTPAMAKGQLQGLATGIATGGAFAAGAALLTAGPDPTDIVTAPIAFKLGFSKGHVAGSFQYWYRQGAGGLYGDLIDEGISDDLAKPLSHMAGAMYGAIEFSQMGKFFPGSDKTLKQLVVSSVRTSITNVLKRRGVDWGSEVAEEVFQEIILESSKEIAKQVEGKTNSTIAQSIGNIPKNSLKKVVGKSHCHNV